MHVEVQGVTASDLALPPAAEGNAEVAGRVAAARQLQRERFADYPIRTNAEAEGELLDTISKPDAAGSKLLTEAAERMKLSARGYHRVLKVARTIADLAGAASVARPHIAEALSYRRITHIWRADITLVRECGCFYRGHAVMGDKSCRAPHT